MKVTLNWLKDFVDIDIDVEVLADKLVKAGFEVEEIINQSANMKNVVLGKIVDLQKHPDADKLQICQIDIGNNTITQIVTGAQNVSVGDIIPVACHNSLLPNGLEIKKGKLRGIDSNGMLCSGNELCLTEQDYKGASVDGIMLMNSETAPMGTDINVILGNDDIILDISVTANRSDCNSVLGIAREISTILAKPLKMPFIGYNVDKKTNVKDYISVEVEAIDLCPRYMAAAVNDIKICPSDALIQKRLKAVGLRPINSIVDITNYVLMEIGQPMHAFDKNIINGNKIVVRKANESEKIVALDEKEYTLDSKMLAICDNDKPCAIAGIMGGLNSGISQSTDTVIFESAKFLRDNIRNTSRRLNLRSDSSTRFERGIDFESQQLGLMRALTLIDQLGYGKISDGIIDVINADLSAKEITTTTDAIDNILGIKVPHDKMLEILNSLKIATKIEGNKLTCIQPTFRDDIENANDLAEEIIRLYGYENIHCSLMDSGKQTIGGKSDEQINCDTIKWISVSMGASEVLNYSFITPKAFDTLLLAKDDNLRNCVTLLNPLGEDFSVMRTTLAYSMLKSLSSNYIKSNKKARLFEISSVYIPKALPVTELPNEYQHFSFGAYGESENFYTIKGVVEVILKQFNLSYKLEEANISYLHSGRSAQIVCGKRIIGYFGEVHPTVSASFDVKDRMYIAEIDINAINQLTDNTYKYKELSKFPPVERDIAVIVDEKVSVGELLQIVAKGGGNMMQDCCIFDIYRNETALGIGKKSVAIKMVFRLLERSLLEEEVAAKINRILTKLTSEVGAKLR